MVGLRVVDESQWDDTVRTAEGSDVYFGLGYHRASALLEPGQDARPVLLRHDTDGGAWLLPLLVRPIGGTPWFDATSAYGYGGPLGAAPADPQLLATALDDWARAEGIVATFLRSHPLEDNAHLFPVSARATARGTTVAWDLTGDDNLEQQLAPHHRRLVRRAARSGVSCRMHAYGSAGFGDALTRFVPLYELTMRRQGADTFYLFPEAYWERLADPSCGAVVAEASLDGETLASLLCLRSGDRLHYHLGATAEAGRGGLGASHAAFLATATWARGQGVTRFHLGGGLGGASSSLHTFKRRFDPTGPDLPFAIGKLVHDPTAYRELAGTDDVAGFFPPWRASG